MSMSTDAEGVSSQIRAQLRQKALTAFQPLDLEALSAPIRARSSVASPPPKTTTPQGSGLNRVGAMVAAAAVVGGVGILVVMGRFRTPVVSVVEVSSGAASSGVVAEGAIVPSAVAYVTPPITMRDPIAHVYVETGMHVTKGQVLADIDPVTQEAALDQAETNLKSLRTKLHGIGTPYQTEQMKQAQLQVQADQQQVGAAQAALDLLKNGSTKEEIAAASSAVDTAQAQADQAEQRYNAFQLLYTKGSPEVASATADVNAAQTVLDQAQKSYASYKQLYASGAVSRLQYDQAETNQSLAQTAVGQAKERLNEVRRDAQVQFNATQSDLNVAKANLSQAKDRLTLLQHGSRTELIQGAKARLDEARSAEAAQEQAYDLLKSGGSPDLTYKVNYADAVANVQQAEAAVQYRKDIMGTREVRSPISGVVVARNINPGEIAVGSAARPTSSNTISNDTQSMFVIANDESVQFLANVDQRFLGSVTSGQKATVQIESRPGESFSGKVVRFNPVIAAQTQGGGNNAATTLTFPTWIQIKDPNHHLILGQSGYVNITGSSSGIELPQAAVVPMTLGQGVVYVEKAGIVETRTVHFTGSGDGNVRITDGLTAGDRVIVSDPKQIKDGQKVEPVLTSPKGSGMAPM